MNRKTIFSNYILHIFTILIFHSTNWVFIHKIYSCLLNFRMLSCIYNAQHINPHMNVVLCCCSSATIEDIWWPKTSWTRPWTSLKVSLETDPARVDPDGRTSPCWWPTMTTPPTRCLCSFQVRCDAGVMWCSDAERFMCAYLSVLCPPEEMKVGIKTIKMYCQRMQEENIARAIIVVQTGMTPSAKQVRHTHSDLSPETPNTGN